MNPNMSVFPHPSDVLCGRDRIAREHLGNMHWRRLVRDNKQLYRDLPKFQKRRLSESIVFAVASQQPPGRFLRKDPETGWWQIVGKAVAVEKTSQALREKGSVSGKLQASSLLGPSFTISIYMPTIPQYMPKHAAETMNGNCQDKVNASINASRDDAPDTSFQSVPDSVLSIANFAYATDARTGTRKVVLEAPVPRNELVPSRHVNETANCSGSHDACSSIIQTPFVKVGSDEETPPTVAALVHEESSKRRAQTYADEETTSPTVAALVHEESRKRRAVTYPYGREHVAERSTRFYS